MTSALNNVSSALPALSIRQLCKTYGNGFEALRNIDLDVSQGDFFALLGPNGAGKSTTIGIISSLVQKSAGQVAIFGHDTVTAASTAKQLLGVVPQEFNFNQFEKVLDIVVNQAGFYGMPRGQALSQAEKYLKKLDLWDKRDVQARMLSGGMKRRLMIARALVHEPQLLILDEPTAGVDIELRRSMWGFLREINAAGTTIILTTHYLEEAESLCRNIAIIDQGRIVINTNMRDLLRQLNQETFVLDLREPVQTLPAVEGFQLALVSETTIEATVTRGQAVNGLFDQLSQVGVDVVSLRNKSNRLEELFVTLVARSQQERSVNA